MAFTAYRNEPDVASTKLRQEAWARELIVSTRCWSIRPTKTPVKTMFVQSSKLVHWITVCHRRQTGGLDAARTSTRGFCSTRLYSSIRPVVARSENTILYMYPYAKCKSLLQGQVHWEWIVEQFTTIAGCVRIPGRSPPSLRLWGFPAVW